MFPVLLVVWTTFKANINLVKYFSPSLVLVCLKCFSNRNTPKADLLEKIPSKTLPVGTDLPLSQPLPRLEIFLLPPKVIPTYYYMR